MAIAAGFLLATAAPASAAPTTFATDVAPLLYEHCATCHRPGGASSTTLLTYQDARSHARQIVEMTASHVMPPWQPEGARDLFDGDRRLQPEQSMSSGDGWTKDCSKAIAPACPRSRRSRQSGNWVRRTWY